MANIGKKNSLRIVKSVDFGVYLDGGEHGEILLPRRYLPETWAVGDKLEVFIYLDTEDKLIATTQRPRIMVGQCAYLKVKAVNDYGAFLDWGLSKDLLVPYSEQTTKMKEGNDYVVYCYLDEDSDRIAATTKLHEYLDEYGDDFEPEQAVSLLICGRTDMGYKAVINNSHLGLIFKDDAFKPLKYGMKLDGYIKAIRADGKIDLCLQLAGQVAKKELADQILDHLKAEGGVSSLTDKSAAEDIYETFNVSKKSYKKALGALYKRRMIVIENDQIKLA